MNFDDDDMEVGEVKSFIKLKDKESIQGVFRGDFYKFKQHWVENKSYPCAGDTVCEYCKKGLKPTKRFRLNFITKDNGVYAPKIWEQGPTVYQQLKELNKEYPLEHHVVKITRSGLQTETAYTILPVKNGALNAEQETAISKVPLNYLGHEPVSAGSGFSPEPTGSSFMEEDIPF